VVCGNYTRVADALLDRADTVVLYDLPRRIVMWRIVRRTLRRVLRREELWNGNRERWQNLVSVDPEISVIAWAWRTHGPRHEWVEAFLEQPPRDDLLIVHLTTPHDEQLFYAGLRVAVRA
jgi:adenylate kinase family enzyme